MNRIIHDILGISGKILQKLRIFSYPPFLFFLKKEKQVLTDEECLNILHTISEDLGESCIRNIPVESSNEFDVQIIVPVYNVEKYLKHCLDSIISQKTDASFLITVINDGSTDNSAKILNRYQDHPQIEIIHQDNKGFSGARNTGLDNLKGRYIMFVDSDDSLTENAIQSLYVNTKNEDLDIIVGAYNSVDNQEKKLSTVHFKKDSIKGFAWGKLYKASLFKTIQFPVKYWFEDTVISLIILYLTDKISIINQPVYNYRFNPSGITRKSLHQPKILDTVYVTQRLLQDFKRLKISATESFYERLLRQIRINQIRLWTLRNPEIEKFNFMLSCNIMENFTQFTTNNKKYKALEKALRRKNFNLFLFACGC